MRLWRDRVFVVSLIVAAVGLLVGLVLSTGAAGSRPAAGAQAVDLQDVGKLTDVVGRPITARDARVESVPADEGFWVAGTGDDRFWVQVDTAGESPFVVKAGDRVTFTGLVVAHGPDFAESPDFSALDAEELVRARAHIEVQVDALHLS